MDDPELNKIEATIPLDDLGAQLAAEQDNARQSREEIEALKGDVAAMAANQGERMRFAIDLARRCDEAQKFIKHQIEWDEQRLQEISDLRAQLAAAQETAAEQGRHAVSIFDECKKLQAELAAAQARVTALNNENITLSFLLMDERRDKDAAQAELTRLQQESTAHRVAWQNAEQRERELVEALEDMVAANYGVSVMPTPEARAQNRARDKARATLAKHKEAQT
jgi:chromosome segregation ATPase